LKDSDHRGPRVRAVRPSIEGLEGRQLLSSTLPDIAMISATTTDSKGVTINYEIKGGPITRPTEFAVFRSATTTLDASAVAVGSAEFVPGGQPGATLDSNGRQALAVGQHVVTIPLPGGLPIDPKHPNVLVVANADGAVTESNTSNDTASFRKYVIGVITHGGVQPKKWTAGPPWERRMASGLAAQGYDAVIPFNWVSQSNHAGSAALEAPRLASMVLQAAGAFPPTDPVDVHFIGHSEGAVVNSQAILRLNQSGWTPALKAGYLKVTMLDPHAASSAFSGQQYSVSNGVLGFIARQMINDFQSRAKDPAVVVPANVDSAEVFYQHTPVSKTHGSNGGIYNLWGQVPVQGQANYFNITAPGISHSGKFGVQDWYRLNVVPTLGASPSFVPEITLTGSRVDTNTPSVGPGGRPRTQVTYAGHAAPGAPVRIVAEAAGTSTFTRIGHAVAGPDGSWQVTTRPLVQSHYKVVAVSNVMPILTQHVTPLKPTAWLAPLDL
jgi:hypothetical protein